MVTNLTITIALATTLANNSKIAQMKSVNNECAQNGARKKDATTATN